MSRILPQYVQAYLVVVWLSIRRADTVRVTSWRAPRQRADRACSRPLALGHEIWRTVV